MHGTVITVPKTTPATPSRYLMKRIAQLLLIVLSLPLAAHADDASHRAKAEELIGILHLDRLVNAIEQNAVQQAAQYTSQRYGGSMTPTTLASLSDFQKKLHDFLEPQIGWSVIKPDYVNQFVQTFPEDQLDTMLAFYKSPAGQALMTKMPTIEQSVGTVVQGKVKAIQPQVKQLFDDYQKSLPQPGAAPAPGTPPASTTKPSTTPTTPGKTTPQ